MRRLSIGGKTTEVSDQNFYGLISNLADGYYIVAEAYYKTHASGFADWKRIFQFPDVGQYEMADAIADQIDDHELSEAFGSLRNHLSELQGVDQKIISWLVQYVGLSSIHDKKDKARLERRLNKIIVNGPDGHPQGPIWAMQPEYQAFVKESKGILSEIDAAQRRVIDRIKQLRSFFEDPT